MPHTISTDASLGSEAPPPAISGHAHAGRVKSLSLEFDSSDPVSAGGTTLTDLAGTGGMSRLRRSGRAGSSTLSADVQVMVVWLESFEDYLTFPVGM